MYILGLLLLRNGDVLLLPAHLLQSTSSYRQPYFLAGTLSLVTVLAGVLALALKTGVFLCLRFGEADMSVYSFLLPPLQQRFPHSSTLFDCVF